MRIVVTSDSHRREGNLFEIIERHLDNADLFINLGDGENDVDSVLMVYPNLNIKRVAGNNDWYSKHPNSQLIEFAGKRIFFAHGHTYYVKHGYERIIQKAKEMKADICLFGHTHTPFVEIIDGIYFMNPGAVCNNSYGIIDIVDDKILAYNTKV